MEGKEKQNIKLRFGLCLRNILDKNKAIFIENEKNGIEDKGLVKSIGKLATLSGIPKASIIRIISGKINTSSSTLAAIIDTLEIGLSGFGAYYDSISEKDIEEYKKELVTKQKGLNSKKNKRQKYKK